LNSSPDRIFRALSELQTDHLNREFVKLKDTRRGILKIAASNILRQIEEAECRVVVDVCAAIVDFRSKLQRRIVGTCSAYLRDLQMGDIVPAYIERCIGLRFRVPPDIPVVMVCPGTGLSPCRALLQERYFQWVHLSCDQSWELQRQRDIVFLGFRNVEKDYLYGTEWALYREMADIHVAFSRDQPYGKVYVQDLIEAKGHQVAQLLVRHGGFLFICGQSHPMPSQVHKVLVDVLAKHTELTPNSSEEFLSNMLSSGRYVCDTWG